MLIGHVSDEHYAALSDVLVELRSRRGTAVLRARLTDGIRPDTVFAPFHWPGANALTNPVLDPHSRMPAFKACAVALQPIQPPQPPPTGGLKAANSEAS